MDELCSNKEDDRSLTSCVPFDLPATDCVILLLNACSANSESLSGATDDGKLELMRANMSMSADLGRTDQRAAIVHLGVLAG